MGSPALRRRRPHALFHRVRVYLGRVPDEVFDVAGLWQVTIDTNRGTESHQVIRECEVIASVKSDAADLSDVVRLEVSSNEWLRRSCWRCHVWVFVQWVTKHAVWLSTDQSWLEDVVAIFAIMGYLPFFL